MSPPYLHDHHPRSCNNKISPLKINRDSCYIKKSSSSLLLNQQQEQQRHHPVIIYTHSPKIIHTHPRDFMALVQKLTGLSSHDDNGNNEPNSVSAGENNNSSCNAVVHSSSACCIPPQRPIFDPLNEDRDSQNIFNDLGESLDFLCSAHQPLSNYMDSLFFMSTMETSITSSSSSFESMKEFPHF